MAPTLKDEAKTERSRSMMITYHLRIGEIGNVVRSEDDDEAGSGDDSDGRDDAAGIRRQQTTVAAALVIPSRPIVKKRK